LLVKRSIESFQGVDRRFTFKGTTKEKSIDIFDDYGHHPTEIHHSLITARRKTKNNLIVVFQPQRYSRTYHLWNEFVKTFQLSTIDHLIITDIYPASEAAIPCVTGEELAKDIQKMASHINVHFIPFQTDLDKIKNKIISIASENDLLLLLGAGKINKLAEKLLP
jgi:UDP-N-acetylmuramate--alanine ligase